MSTIRNFMGGGEWKPAGFWFSGALAAPAMAWIYDWNPFPLTIAITIEEES